MIVDGGVVDDIQLSLLRCMLQVVRPVWMTFLRYNFSVAAVCAVICSKTAVNGQSSLLKSYPNWP